MPSVKSCYNEEAMFEIYNKNTSELLLISDSRRVELAMIEVAVESNNCITNNVTTVIIVVECCR